jgi:hypothetical protein
MRSLAVRARFGFGMVLMGGNSLTVAGAGLKAEMRFFQKAGANECGGSRGKRCGRAMQESPEGTQYE